MEENLFLQAIELFAQFTGVKAPESKEDRYKTRSYGDYKVHEKYENLREAIELDPSEVTANLMLSYYVRDMLGDEKLSMMDLLNDPQGYLRKLELPRKLLEIVNREDVVRARDAFIERLKQALKRYGADERKEVLETLAKHDSVAFLRRDALRGVERLQINQFLSGAPEPDGYRPVYHAQVFQWWNINSLLQAATQMPSGVSLNLIRDRDAYQSYFVFCIRNGANLYILHDAPEYRHPLQGEMTRRPDRALGERACRAWFPYDLLGLQWDEELERWYIENSDEKAVAIYQQEWKPLAPISSFEDPRETIWVTMMLDLIVRKFWGQGYQAPALSYTGEMLKIESRLIEKAQAANLPVAQYQPLALEPLTIESISTDNVRADQVGKKGSGRNRWLEDRYKDKVDPAILNLTEQAGTRVLLPGTVADSFGRPKAIAGGTDLGGGLKKFTGTEMSRLDHFGRKDVEAASLAVMDSTRFGTREQIEADRVFIARANFARAVTKLAYEEYDRRKDEVVKWYLKACERNLPAILSWAANEDIWLDMGLKASSSHNDAGGRQRYEAVSDKPGAQQRIFRSWIKRVDLNEEKRTKDYDYSLMGAQTLGGFDRSGYRCAVNDAKASYYVGFYPSNSIELAVLAGCAVDALPDVLQHWQQGKDYVGNHILDRIDPMEWKASDPWRKLNLKLRVPLSIRGLRQIEKSPALPPLPYLAKPEDVERFRQIDEQAARQRAEDIAAALAPKSEDEPTKPSRTYL